MQPEQVGGGRKFLTYTAPLPLGPVPPERHPSLVTADSCEIPLTYWEQGEPGVRWKWLMQCADGVR